MEALFIERLAEARSRSRVAALAVWVFATIDLFASRARAVASAFAKANTISFNLAEGADAERIDGANVTADFARVLGVQPIIGRMFSEQEDKPKAPPVAIIGEGLWRERFGGVRMCSARR